MSNITIRQAEPRDAPLLPAVEVSGAKAFLQIPTLAWIARDNLQSEARHLEFISSGAALVAVDNRDAPVGFINGELIEDNLHICELTVKLDFQGRGIGRSLVQAVKEWAASRGCATITLTAFREVPWNKPFYESMEFQTLKPSEVTQYLSKIMEEEADAGLAPELRCAMTLPVAPMH